MNLNEQTNKKAEEDIFFKISRGRDFFCDFVFYETAVTMGGPSTGTSLSHMTCFKSSQRKNSFATLEQK